MTSTVVVDAGTVEYTSLLRIGAKQHEPNNQIDVNDTWFANAQGQGGVVAQTRGGKSYKTLIRELNLDTLASSLGKCYDGGDPISYWNNILVLQKAIITDGGQISMHFIGCGHQRNVVMTKGPGDVTNVPPSTAGAGSGGFGREEIARRVQEIIDFDASSGSARGINVFSGIEPDNEPETNLGSATYGKWGNVRYTPDDPANTPGAAATGKFAIDIHRWYADYLEAAHPGIKAKIGGYAYAQGASCGSNYVEPNLREFIAGWSGSRWSDGNLAHMGSLNLHCYGESYDAAGYPGASKGEPQYTMNTIFYTGYVQRKGGYFAAYSHWRGMLDSYVGGTAIGLKQTEGWIIDDQPTRPQVGWTDAGAMVCSLQNSNAWKLQEYLFWSSGPTGWIGYNTDGTPSVSSGQASTRDSLVVIGNDARIYYTPRYVALKMLLRFGQRGGYTLKCPTTVSTRDTPPSSESNPSKAVQVYSARHASSGAFAMVLCNCDWSTGEDVVISLNRLTTSTVTGERYTQALTLDSTSEALTSVAGSGVSQFSYHLGPGEVAVLTMTLSGSAPTQQPPQNQIAPTITGNPNQGQTLTGADGTWAPAGLTIARRWLRCDVSGANASPIASATGTTYVLTAADVGFTIRYEVTETTTDVGAATARSTQTALIQPPSSAATLGRTALGSSVTNLFGSYVLLSGPYTLDQAAAHVESIVVYAAGDSQPVQIRGVLFSDSAGAPGTCVAATDPLTLAANAPAANQTIPMPGRPAEQAGAYWVGVWVGSNGNPGGRYQAATGRGRYAGCAFATTGLPVVTQPYTTFNGEFNVYANVTLATLDSPVNTDLPTITGTTYEGDTLTWHSGTWTNSPTFARQWQRVNPVNGAVTDIGSATGTTYVSTSDDIGFQIRLRVRATAAGTAVDAFSVPTATIEQAAPYQKTPPVVTGTLAVGAVLSGSVGTYGGKPPITTDRQWQRGDADGLGGFVDIGGQTGATYTLVSGDNNHTVRLKVTVDGVGSPFAVYSVPTPTITLSPVIVTLEVAPTVTGLAQVGQTLTRVQGQYSGTAPIVKTGQWQRKPTGGAWANIGGATTATYVVRQADTGYQLHWHEEADNGIGDTLLVDSLPTESVISLGSTVVAQIRTLVNAIPARSPLRAVGEAMLSIAVDLNQRGLA